MKHIKALLDLLNESPALKGTDSEALKRATQEFERLQAEPDASDLLKRAADKLQDYAESIDPHADLNDSLAMQIYNHLESERARLCRHLGQTIDQTMHTIQEGEASGDDFARLAQLTREKQTLC